MREQNNVPQGEGYEEGYRQGVRDIAERLKKYYTMLPLPKVQPTVVEYTIRVLEEELIGEK